MTRSSRRRDPENPNRAHALAFPLTLLVRPMIDGPVPFFVVDKPSPRTGAGLLLETSAEIVLGSPPALTTEPREDDAWLKKITSIVKGAPQFVIWDNLRRRLDNPHLSAVLTATVWQDRLLGFTEMGHWPVRCVWAATANNVRLSAELAARSVACRLDAKTEKPGERSGWRHPLPAWARAERPRLLAALCTLVTAWLGRGGAAPAMPFGRFEAWAGVPRRHSPDDRGRRVPRQCRALHRAGRYPDGRDQGLPRRLVARLPGDGPRWSRTS